MEVYNKIVTDINRFIDKFYLNIAFRGAIFFFTILLSSTLLFSLIEYFMRLGTTLRALFFYSFILLNLFTLLIFIVLPLLKKFRVLKTISIHEAAVKIGVFFPEIGDKLLNTLQLNEQLASNHSVVLLSEAVRQRVNSFKWVRFDKAIQWKENFKYFRFLLPFFLLFLAISLFNPKIFSESSERIFNYNNEYIPPSPFEFILTSDSLNVMEGEPFKVELKLTGTSLPNRVTLVTEEASYFMRKTGKSDFYYDFPSPDKNLKFYFSANGYRSKTYTLNIIPKPQILSASITVVPPLYTKVPPENYNHIRDIVIPEGSCVKWVFNTKNIGRFSLIFPDTLFSKRNKSQIVYDNCIKNHTKYTLLAESDLTDKADSLYYAIDVVKDAFPQISAEMEEDTNQVFVYYFSGVASDDYGINPVFFNYTIRDREGNVLTTQRERIKENRSGNSSKFFHFKDFKELELLKPGVTIDFYFSVSDNDQVNGSKTSLSKTFNLIIPTDEELAMKDVENTSASANNMDQASKKLKELNKEMNEFKNSLLQKNTTDWQDLEKFKELKNKRNDLQKELEKIKDEFKKNNELMENLKKDDELDKKQELIDELLENLIDDELKELLDELEELLKENQNPREELRNLDQQNTDLEKELDRTLELLKHLDIEKRIDNLEERLDDLSKQQEELSQENTKKSDSEEMLKKQEEINKEFDKIKNDIKELEQKNQELKSPKSIDPTEQDQEKIDETIKDAKEQLEQNNQKKSKEKQQSGAEQMQELSKKFGDMKMQMQMQQNQEDMEALRVLLENLLSLSLHQEEVMLDFRGVEPGSLKYNELARKQKKIVDNSKMVEDSLTSLASRNPMLSSMVNKELNDLKRNQNSTIKKVVDSDPSFPLNQQYSMTSYNNLALMLSEALDQMQNQMAQQMQGNAMCNSPSGSKPSSGMSMEQMKEMLRKQMEKMKDGKEGEDGKKPGPDGNTPIKIPGGKEGEDGMSAKERAQLAKEQAKMKESLKELKEKAGKEIGKQLQELINELERSEDDIVNNRLDQQWFKRQQDILTRLLESEKAMRERGFEEERESKSGKNKKSGNQNQYLEYKMKKEKELELLRSLPPELNLYYRNKAGEYFNKVLH